MAFTYFFRDLHTLEIVRDHVIPSLRSRRFIRIWDAGCAMGPEPYTLSIVLRENMGATFGNVKIFATDIDESGHFGEIIKKGVYPEDQVKRISSDIFNKYFTKNGQEKSYKIADELRRSVDYQTHDLLSLKPINKDFGLILCKNVLLHFKESERIKVIKMFHDALAPGGFFVTEQTQKLPKEVERMFERVVSNAQLFKKK